MVVDQCDDSFVLGLLRGFLLVDDLFRDFGEAIFEGGFGEGGDGEFVELDLDVLDFCFFICTMRHLF